MRLAKVPDLVLVVDDERGVRESLRFVLEPHFRVHAVTSGEAALAVVRSGRASVVLLDLSMPGLSGSETLAAIRQIDEDVPVVIVTGYGSSSDTKQALRLGVFDFVTKPLDPKRVLSVVRRALEKRLAGRDAAGEHRGQP